MKTVTLNGQSVAAIGMGSWHLGQGRHSEAAEINALRAGIDSGLRVIDTAEMYGDGRSESLIGKAIDGQRDRVYLVSKIYPYHANRLMMERSCNASLKRLNTDCLDLYLLHWRFSSVLSEAVSGFEKLKQQGKIKAWGVSNFDVDDMEDLFAVEQGDRCATNQVFYNPASRGIEFDLIPWCNQHHMPMMAYSPLGGEGASLLRHPLITQLAAKYQTGPSTVLLAWVIRNGNMIAIPESGEAAHIKENAAALSVQLQPADLRVIDEAFPPPTRKMPLETR
ncbi:MAG: aldo/keto reductase [Pantoea sp.]|uniref:aldo/keto reductase n=1 Tax=Pantoea sp. TaxID=69393 RepID=UPI00239648EC|nr:aldo/keto reductase [Pantoea sp.]MDE1190261.1 aldo/keto reductase [Pantoea sp.]